MKRGLDDPVPPPSGCCSWPEILFFPSFFYAFQARQDKDDGCLIHSPSLSVGRPETGQNNEPSCLFYSWKVFPFPLFLLCHAGVVDIVPFRNFACLWPVKRRQDREKFLLLNCLLISPLQRRAAARNFFCCVHRYRSTVPRFSRLL